MKKLMTLAAIAALAVGCNFPEPSPKPVNTDGAINFRTVTGTKAFEEMNATNIKTFAMFGEWVDGATVQTTNQFDFAFNKNIGRVGTTWVYEPTLYWPVNGDVNFYAYSPFGSVNVTNFVKTDAKPIITYKNPDNAAATTKHQEDFLVAATLGQNKTTPGINPVQIMFYHALSQAVFIAKSSLKDVTFEVLEVRILNLDDQAKFDLSKTNYNGTTGRPDPTAWANFAGNKVDHIAYSSNSINDGIVIPYRTEVNKYRQLGTPIVLIPQPIDSLTNIASINLTTNTNTVANQGLADAALAAAQATGKVLIGLKYKAYTTESDPKVNKDVTWVFFNINLNKPNYNGSLNPAITTNTFVMGAHYTFVFNLNGDLADLVPITFDVVGVDGWVDPTDFAIVN